jgi:hypothetical protein
MWSYSLAFRFSEPACIAIHVSQSKPHAIRNLLRLLKMQVNIPERNNGNYGNVGDFSNFATLASFRQSQDRPDFRAPDYCSGWPGLGIESLDSEWFWSLLG